MFSISNKDVEAVILRVFGSGIKILKYELKPFSENKNGIFGTHSCLTVDIMDKSGSNNIKSFSFFVKMRPDSPIVQSDLMDECIFLEEINFYNTILPLLIQNCRSEKWIPQCYLVKEDALVFEDLRAQGYDTVKENLLDEQYLKSAISALARFHAASILTEKNLDKTLKEVYPNAFNEKLYIKLTKLSACTIVGYQTLALMVEKFGMDTNLVQKIYDRVYESVKPTESAFNVICHGDLWKNNILFDKSVPPKCILVDYQLLRYASPCIDLSMLLYLNTTPEYRKKSETNMIKYYYSILYEIIMQNNNQAKIPTYENFHKDYMKIRLVGMTYALLYLPGIYLKQADFENLLNNADALKQWFLHNRFDTIKQTLDTDPVYEKKMKDLVSELLGEAKRICNT